MSRTEKSAQRMGLTNVEIMIPFVRTVGEARQVVELLAEPMASSAARMASS